LQRGTIPLDLREMNWKRSITRSIAFLIVMLFVITVLFWPTLPWSAQYRKSLRRTIAKVRIVLADWQDNQPREVSLTGRLIGNGAFSQALKGAEVVATESSSGYASMSDSDGRFVLPHLIWYPGAEYNLTITADEYHIRQLSVRAPSTVPPNKSIDVGDLLFEEARRSPMIERPVRYLTYDSENDDYYQRLFKRLTAGAGTDHEKIDAVSKYIRTRHNPNENAWSFKCARQIIERGAPHCSNLAFAMAIVVAAGGYPARSIHTSDSPEYLHTHVQVEVFYGDGWHLYDPTYGIFFLDGTDTIASYEQLRLHPELITGAAFQGFDSKTVNEVLQWMPKAISSGFNQIYEVKNGDTCVVW
jgi:Transglutaminase-like superfamily